MNNAKGQPDQKSLHSKRSELALRTVSAVVLVAIALLALYLGGWPFILMIMLGGVILAHEWTRITLGECRIPSFWVFAFAVTAACLLVAFGRADLAVITLAVATILTAIIVMRQGKELWTAAGVLYIGLPCILLILFRNTAVLGLSSVLFLFLMVWSSDTAAYFTGRSISGPKLAPAISPGKTWSGFFGGLTLPAVCAFWFAGYVPASTNALLLAIAGVFLALFSQLGDLAESAIKRKFKVKDSGKILPGHGGLFDRTDGLIGALLLAGAIVWFRGIDDPGRALLVWP